MKNIVALLGLIALSSLAQAQVHHNEDITPDSTTYTNVYVKKMHSDERTSVFAIWVKKEVKAHKHEQHTEVVFVLEGKGKMVVGEKKQRIKKGDTIIIPQGTVHSVKTSSRKPLKVISVQAPIFLGVDRIWIN